MNDLAVLLGYLKKYLSQLAFGIICVVFTVIFSLIPPWILKLAIDGLTRDGDLGQLFNYAVLIVIVTTIAGSFRFLMRRSLIGLSRKVEYHIRNDYYTHLQKMTLSFFLEWRTGDLISRISNDLNAVRNVLGPGIMYTVHTTLLFVSSITLMIIISPNLTLVTLIPMLLLTLVTKYFSRQVFVRYQAVQENLASLSNKVQENLAGIRIVKAYGREDHEAETFQRISEDYLETNMALARIWSAFFPFLITLSGVGVVIVLWFGGEMVIFKQLSLGDLVAFMGYWTLLTWPMMALGWVMNVWQRGAVAMKRINQVMRSSPTIIDGSLTVKRFTPRIKFDNLSFRYPGTEKTVLENINLVIEPGMTVAVVGATGTGKSTLVNLIPHLWEIERGVLRISGEDINDFPLTTLREQIGMVNQEPFLFSDSIRNNIVFGAAMVSDDKLDEVLQTSQLINDIDDFPDGLETRIGERGITLSGGQRQRLAIARALIRDAAILILDDALSSVDLHTEEEILKRLTGVVGRRTCLLVSHRLSSIRNADLILMLADKQIVEMGKHRQLIAAKGAYYELYRRQQLLREIEAED